MSFTYFVNVCCAADLNIFDGGYLNNSNSWSFSPLMGAWAVGEQGTIIVNFGKGWQQYASLPSSSSLLSEYKIYTPDTLLNGGFWTVGSWGTVAANSGGTWSKLWAASKSGGVSSTNLSPDLILYNPPSTPVLGGAFMISDRGIVLRDNGAGWEYFAAPQSSATITDLLFYSFNNELILTTTDGKIHSLNTSNMLWTSYQTSRAPSIRAISQVGNDIWCAGGLKSAEKRLPKETNLTEFKKKIALRMLFCVTKKQGKKQLK